MVIKMDLSGAALDDTDAGGVTDSTSGGFCLVAKIKKRQQQKCHVAHRCHVDGSAFAWYFNFRHTLIFELIFSSFDSR